MYYGIMAGIILIQLTVILFFVTDTLVKSRTIHRSVISVGKISLYTKDHEDELRVFQEALKLILMYIDSRIRAVVTEQNSDSMVNGKRVVKPVEEIYMERGQISQLGAIRGYVASLIIKKKGQ